MEDSVRNKSLLFRSPRRPLPPLLPQFSLIANDILRSSLNKSSRSGRVLHEFPSKIGTGDEIHIRFWEKSRFVLISGSLPSLHFILAQVSTILRMLGITSLSQVYHKFHKLKAQWKIILEAKNLSGANFDDVNKIILYDETEVVRMKNNKDKRAKYINVPIASYDEMEFIFRDKHATGEFTILQAPYDRVSASDKDFIGDKNDSDTEVDPATQYDSDCLPGDGNNESSSSKRPRGGKRDKGKRVKCDDSAVLDMTQSLRDMSSTMRFTHVTNPNEAIFKIIDDMEVYPMYIRLSLQTSLATNEQVASMLKGRPMPAIIEWVARWVADNFPDYTPPL